ncbi:MAG: FAD-binding oxidoreductase, partial [Bacteroidota bacterium]
RFHQYMELTGYDESLNEIRLEALKKGASEYLREPYTDEISEKWWGWRPMTYDGLPIIDKGPKHSNLWMACGHSMVGMSMGTGTGKLISEVMLNEKPHISVSPYRYKRFTYGF